eukprot:g25147.t1
MLLHLERLSRPLDSKQGGDEGSGVAPSVVIWEEGWCWWSWNGPACPGGNDPCEMRTGGMRGRCGIGSGILLELSEMVENDPLNAEAGGVKSEDKRGQIML